MWAPAIKRLCMSASDLSLCSAAKGFLAAVFFSTGSGCAYNHHQQTSELDQLLNDTAPVVAQQYSVVRDAVHKHGTMATHSPKLLSLDDAVRLALKNNPSIQQYLAQIDLAEADMYRAASIHNPLVSATKLNGGNDESPFFAYSLMLSVSDLITRNARMDIAAQRSDIAAHEVANAIVMLAARTQQAYYHYLYAQQRTNTQEQIRHLQELVYELAQRFHAAGNLTDLELAEKNANAAQAHITKLRVQSEQASARAALAELLNLSVTDPWQTSQLLPTATMEIAIDGLLTIAQNSRLDLRAAALRVDVLQRQYEATDWQRWVGDIGFELERERETSGERLNGGGLELELPIFNQHKDTVIRAYANWTAAKAQQQQLKLAVENQITTAASQLTLLKQQLTVYEEVLLPAQAAVVDGVVERQNFMLEGGFALLERKLEHLSSEAQYVDALGQYWAAWSALGQALGGAQPPTIAAPEQQSADQQQPHTPEPKHQHHQHH